MLDPTGASSREGNATPTLTPTDDPRLDAAFALITEVGAAGTDGTGLGSELGRRLNVSERTGQRLINAALRNPLG